MKNAYIHRYYKLVFSLKVLKVLNPFQPPNHAPKTFKNESFLSIKKVDISISISIVNKHINAR